MSEYTMFELNDVYTKVYNFISDIGPKLENLTEEQLLGMTVSLDLNEVEKYINESGIFVYDINYITYESVNIIRLFKKLQEADVIKGEEKEIMDEIKLYENYYTPKIIDKKLLNEFRKWNLKTFGPGNRTSGTIDHIKRELIEIEENPFDIYEWFDIIMLSINGAIRHGHSSQDIINAFHKKFEINKNRKWKNFEDVPEGEAITHIKEI